MRRSLCASEFMRLTGVERLWEFMRLTGVELLENKHSMGRNPARLVFDRSVSSRGVLAFAALMLDALSSQAQS